MYTNYAARAIKKMCREVGPRLTGSEAELEAQNRMAEDLRESCDEVRVEEFRLSPRAFMGWVQVAVFCGVLSVLLLFAARFLPRYLNAYIDPQLLTTILLGVGVGVMVLCLFFVITEFLFYKQTLDPFAKKAISHNVIGVRNAAGETKRRIIFSGHADSAMEWRFTYWGGPKLLLPVIILGLLGMVLTTGVLITALVFQLRGVTPEQSRVVWILSIVCACFVPVFLFCLLFYNPKRPVEGANDNLTGCYCSMAMPRFLNDHDIRFENTEVWVVCTGAEEAGLRGAKAFCKAHAKELLAEKDVETVFIGLDTVRDFDYMAVYHKDMTGTVRNGKKASALLAAGAKIAGYDLPYKTVSFGSSDAAAMTQGGLEATCFAAMDPAPARYYHTRLDTWENLDMKTLEAGVDICLETMFLFDEKGLDV
ncbi:MAG: M28 family peptidase [Clostridia bacterium]|nr:M28 family peptidase [Clostridia bacterium]